MKVLIEKVWLVVLGMIFMFVIIRGAELNFRLTQAETKIAIMDNFLAQKVLPLIQPQGEAK